MLAEHAKHLLHLFPKREPLPPTPTEEQIREALLALESQRKLLHNPMAEQLGNPGLQSCREALAELEKQRLHVEWLERRRIALLPATRAAAKAQPVALQAMTKFDAETKALVVELEQVGKRLNKRPEERRFVEAAVNKGALAVRQIESAIHPDKIRERDQAGAAARQARAAVEEPRRRFRESEANVFMAKNGHAQHTKLAEARMPAGWSMEKYQKQLEADRAAKNKAEAELTEAERRERAAIAAVDAERAALLEGKVTK